MKFTKEMRDFLISIGHDAASLPAVDTDVDAAGLTALASTLSTSYRENVEDVIKADKAFTDPIRAEVRGEVEGEVSGKYQRKLRQTFGIKPDPAKANDFDEHLRLVKEKITKAPPAEGDDDLQEELITANKEIERLKGELENKDSEWTEKLTAKDRRDLLRQHIKNGLVELGKGKIISADPDALMPYFENTLSERAEFDINATSITPMQKDNKTKQLLSADKTKKLSFMDLLGEAATRAKVFIDKPTQTERGGKVIPAKKGAGTGEPEGGEKEVRFGGEGVDRARTHVRHLQETPPKQGLGGRAPNSET